MINRCDDDDDDEYRIKYYIDGINYKSIFYIML